jgi:ribosomal protein L11 methyltransferase
VEPDLMLELAVPDAEAEVAADRLWQAGATAVLFRPEQGATTVAASFPTAAAVRAVAGEMAPEGAVVVAADPSWRRVWREHAVPVPVGERLLIAPAWRDVPLRTGRLVLRIDPGDSFGSGTHPSTRIILAELDRHPPAPTDQVLDLGCGSGILAVAAARLGAARVTAVDLDPAALAVTRANATTNGVSDRVVAEALSIEDAPGPFDLALVNVTAAVHADVGPEVIARMATGGRLLLAGLLPGQWRHVAGAYTGARTVGPRSLEGWEGLELAVESRNSGR